MSKQTRTGAAARAPDYTSDTPAFAGNLGDNAIWNVLAFIRSRCSESVRAGHTGLQRQYAERQR